MGEAGYSDTTVLDAVREVVDNATASKVFGSPVTQDGLTVLPVAKVSSGGGGGQGPAEDGQDTGGTGGGLGVSAKPLGVYVIQHGRVTWRPAVDVNRIILGGQIVAVVGLLVLRSLIKARGRAVEST